ncbi:hypothetical protein J7L05_09910 [bacterium]|nr:hypothetical protein [bacterium]
MKLNTIAIGIAVIMSQVIVLREAMVFFTGSELAIGVVLGCWLLFSAAGSYIAGRIHGRRSFTWFVAFQFLLVLFFFVEIYLLRDAGSLIGLPLGETLPLLDILKYSLVLIAPLPFCTGALFPLAIKAMQEISGSNSADFAGIIYMLEVAGNIAGGILVTVFLYYGFSSLFTGSLIILLLLIGGLHYIARVHALNQKRNVIAMSLVLILVCFTGLWYFANIDAIDAESRKLSFGELNVVKTTDSRYGNLAITQDRDLFSFYTNGMISFFAPSKFHSEESIHIPMLQRPDAVNVLLIGGGISGGLDEILKYDVERVDYLELDKTVVQSAVELIDSSTLENVYNGRDEICKIHYGDPWKFIRNSDSSIYDVIIMKLPAPTDALTNRFFTLEFFKDAKRILKPGGVLSFGLASEPNYIGPELLAVNGNIYHTLKTVFSRILITPEDFNYFVATDDNGEITLDPYYLGDVMSEYGINTEYVDMYYLADRLDANRIEFVRDSYEEIENPKLNTILNPHAYFDNLRFTAKQDYIGDDSISKSFLWIVPAGFIALFLICGAVFFRRASKSTLPILILLGVAISGFALMSGEVILIYAYQLYVGYIYERVGVIIAIFMSGMAIGAWLGGRIASGNTKQSMWMAMALFALSLYYILLWLIIPAMPSFSQPMIEFILSVLVFMPGFAGGFIFPIANSIYGKFTSDYSISAGAVYAWDLVGAMIGAIIPSVFIMPYFGLLSAVKIALVLLVVVVLLFSLSRNRFDSLEH